MLTIALALMLTQSSPAAQAVKAADAAMTAADFAEALKILEAIDVRSASTKELESAALLRAECLLTLQRPEEADTALGEAIKLNPAVEFGPNAAPKLIAALSRVKVKMVGTLQLRSNPEGLIALLDGVRVGPLPVELPVVAGKHRVQLEYGTVTKEVEVIAGKAAQVVLEPAPKQEPVAVLPAAPAPSASKALPIALLAVGGVAAATGAVLVGTSQAFNSIDLASITIDDAKARYDSAILTRNLGLGALGVGVAAAAIGAILLLTAPAASATVVVAPSAGGASVGVAGRF